MDKLDRSCVLAVAGLLMYGFLLGYCVSMMAEGGAFVVEWSLGVVGIFSLEVPFVVDGVSLCFSFVVVLISSCVLVYTTSYMDSEHYLSRFVWLVVFFVGFMNLVVFSPSLLSIVLGWDGLGLVSFLLVVYYQSRSSLGAGLVTAFMGRVGDVFLLLSVALFSLGGQWCFWSLDFYSCGSCVVFFMVLMAITKSAQVPFSYWLPMAMSAPTPVSALVHSSTLVTAGVYFLFRVLPVGGGEMVFPMFFLVVVSLFTMVMSGFSACYEADLKKVIALSTLSQLGIMMFALGVGWYALGFFHLVSHALFKALMFIGVGRVIHSCGGFQELRDSGGLWVKMPITAGCLGLASMALMGIPFMGGFYSKDLVVEGFMSGRFSFFMGGFLMLGLFATVIYVIRFFMGVVWGKVSSDPVQVTESLNLFEVVPVLVLSSGAVVGGFYLQGFLFPFMEVFVLEGVFKICLGLVLSAGVVAGLCYSLVDFGVESRLFKVVVSYFTSLWFGSSLVAVFNGVGLQGGQLMSGVDLGWNERVLGGLGVFNVFIYLGSGIINYYKVLGYMWGLYKRSVGSCFVVSLIFMVCILFFFYF